MNPSQPMVLSTGDPTGYGFHGVSTGGPGSSHGGPLTRLNGQQDFFAAWDNAVLAKALKECDGGPTGECV